MSITDWKQPMEGPPQGPGSSRAGSRPLLKMVIVLILLAALGWVILFIAQYCRTGNVSDLPGIPAAGDLINRPSFQYVDSITGLQNPMGVAVGQDGRIYVTETGGERLVHIYNPLREEVGSFAPPDTEPVSRVPVYVAVGPKGDVYVSDRDAAAIFIFSADGEPKGQVAAPEGFEDWHPLGLSFDNAGNLYVTDVTPDKHRVIVLDPDGKLVFSFGSQGEAEGQFWYPNGITVDSKGRMYVTDGNNGRMQAFDKDGNFLFMISRGMSPGDLSIPRGIALDSKDRLLIVDTSRGAVQAYQVSESEDSEGVHPTYLGSFSASVSDAVFFQFPNGLALDGRGNIYVADRANNQVQVWKY